MIDVVLGAIATTVLLALVCWPEPRGSYGDTIRMLGIPPEKRK